MGFLTENELEKRLPMSEADYRDVGRFLNRILGLQVVLQNMVRQMFFYQFLLGITIEMKKKQRAIIV